MKAFVILALVALAVVYHFRHSLTELANPPLSRVREPDLFTRAQRAAAARDCETASKLYREMLVRSPRNPVALRGLEECPVKDKR